MDIQEYLEKLNAESQKVFTFSLSEKVKLGTLHHLSSCIFEFSNCIPDPQEKGILENVSALLESANFNLALGFYRQGFSSLRLALEMGLAAIYFSANKLELHEWLEGRIDIKWYKLVDEENGVLSKRFARAFFNEISNETENYRKKSITTYRKLSEYVHGNYDTWVNDGIKPSYNPRLFSEYCDYYKTSTEIILFSVICRYAQLIGEEARESLQFVPEEFSHISKIRDLFCKS